MTNHADLIARLRCMPRYAHDDKSIGDEAAEALEQLAAEDKRLSAQLANVNARCDHLGMRLGEVIKERDALRLVAGRVAVIGHVWDAKHQQHIPQVVMQFESVPANSPNDAKGWRDRDAFVAAMQK